jgi:hypothetical protein
VFIKNLGVIGQGLNNQTANANDVASPGDALASADERLRIQLMQWKPAIDKLHGWLTEHRVKVPEGSATAKAM